MDAYVLGQHDGDLPTHLLERGELGNRVRAMATLDGPDHNVFYAIEAPDQNALDTHTASLAEAGTDSQRTMSACLDPDCLPLLGKDSHVIHPSFIPPCLYYLFHWLFHPGDPEAGTDFVAEGLDKAREILGDDGVAASTDGNGNVLIELGGNDEAKLAEAQAALQAHFGDNLSSGHAVTGAGVVKA
jgi:hypothetical protein